MRNHVLGHNFGSRTARVTISDNFGVNIHVLGMWNPMMLTKKLYVTNSKKLLNSNNYLLYHFLNLYYDKQYIV